MMTSPADRTTTCRYLEEGFAATYAIGALDGDEATTFATHLPACSACQEEVASLSAVTAHLGLAAPETTPPAALRDRLLDAARSAPTGAVEPTAPRAISGDSARLGRAAGEAARPQVLTPNWRRGASAYALAAVLLLGISLGLLGWNFLLQRQAREAIVARDQAQADLIATRGQLDQARAQLASWNLVPARGQTGTGTLLYLPQQQQAIVVVNGLPPLPPGQVYQIWLIQNGTPSGVGLLQTPTGEAALRVDLSQYQMVAITIEPGPTGSPAPTTPPILTGAVGQ